MIDVKLQLKRIGWFVKLVKRFDLISFERIADELSRERGSINRSALARQQAYLDLANAILRGEFGTHRRDHRVFPAVVRMPNRPKILEPAGSYPLRVSIAQITWLLANNADVEYVMGGERYGFVGDFWAPRPLFRAWFETRPDLPVPAWLVTGPLSEPRHGENGSSNQDRIHSQPYEVPGTPPKDFAALYKQHRDEHVEIYGKYPSRNADRAWADNADIPRKLLEGAGGLREQFIPFEVRRGGRGAAKKIN